MFIFLSLELGQSVAARPATRLLSALLVLRAKQSVALGRAAAVAGFVDRRGLGSVADCGAAGA